MRHEENAPPTKKQIETLAAVQRLTKQRGTGPTLDELAQELELSGGSSAQYRVRALDRAGWLTYTRTRQHRALSFGSLRLTEEGQRILTQYQWLVSSHLLRGELEVVLTGAELALAQEIQLPFDMLEMHGERDKHILSFTAEAERDLWARMLLQEMEKRRR